jgi:peptidoglycan hydrolase CwlO-like protein
MKNTTDTQKILAAIQGLEGRIGRLESKQQETTEALHSLTLKQQETSEALQSLASHMDRRFDEAHYQTTNLFRAEDRKVDNLINALAKKKVLTRPEANTLIAAGPVM